MAERDVRRESFDNNLYNKTVREIQDRIERQFLQLEIPKYVFLGPIYDNFKDSSMTEKEWLTSNDARKMFNWLTYLWPSDNRLVRVTDRKLRLFAIAYCYKFLLNYHPNVDYLRHLANAEHMAENDLPPDTSSGYWIDRCTPLDAARHVAGVEHPKGASEYNANMLREIFGNPWVELNRYSWYKNLVYLRRTDIIDFRHEWITLDDGRVGKIAETIYKDRDWASLPILADALEDVGCNSGAVMTHFRDDRIEHVRGCWALDLVMAKDKNYARSSRTQK